MLQKRKIAFYCILATGHVNLCASIGKVLLDLFPDQIEIYFFVDELWRQKLEKIDSRFKYVICVYDTYDEARLKSIIENVEKFMGMPLIDRLKGVYDLFVYDSTEEEIDKVVEEAIEDLKPNLVLCDQFRLLPSLLTTKVNYGFVSSTSPSIFLIDNYPFFGSDAGVNEKDKIEEFRKAFSYCRAKCIQSLHER